jgi:hypothetical protein
VSVRLRGCWGVAVHAVKAFMMAHQGPHDHTLNISIAQCGPSVISLPSAGRHLQEGPCRALLMFLVWSDVLRKLCRVLLRRSTPTSGSSCSAQQQLQTGRGC